MLDMEHLILLLAKHNGPILPIDDGDCHNKIIVCLHTDSQGQVIEYSPKWFEMMVKLQ